MWVMHFATLKHCALITIMWVLPKFVLVYGFIMPYMYCILGFCSMMNVYRIINYLGAGICPISFNHGKCQATNYQKPLRAYMVNIYGINLFYFFNSYTKYVIIYILKVFCSRYQCRYGLEDYRENSTHT
jgi:hypothetical protein